tara:strand:+ start:50 stop:250 length:201 start_codon:yes stop_codon:yes gene_type:complete
MEEIHWLEDQSCIVIKNIIQDNIVVITCVLMDAMWNPCPNNYQTTRIVVFSSDSEAIKYLKEVYNI